MKRTVLKTILAALILPSLSFAAVQKGGKAADGHAADAAVSALETTINTAKLNIQADKLQKAVDDGVISQGQVDTLAAEASDAASKRVVENVFNMAIEMASYNKQDLARMYLPKVKAAKDKLIELAVSSVTGGTYSKDNLNTLMNTVADLHHQNKSPEDVFDGFENALTVTAGAEAKAESKDTGKSLLELLPGCSK